MVYDPEIRLIRLTLLAECVPVVGMLIPMQCYFKNVAQTINKTHFFLRFQVSSFILVLDVQRGVCSSVLEMEMTVNRTPDLGMYPLRDGSRLFVQEIFENRTIFFQSFTLLPVGRMLEGLNI